MATTTKRTSAADAEDSNAATVTSSSSTSASPATSPSAKRSRTIATSSIPSSNQHLTFSTLSEDLLLAIFEYLNGRDLFQLDTASKNVHRIVDQPYLWRNLALRNRAWPFAAIGDRQFLEHNTLRHMRKAGNLETASTVTHPNVDTDLLQRMVPQKYCGLANPTEQASKAPASPQTQAKKPQFSSPPTTTQRLAYYRGNSKVSDHESQINWRRIVACDERRNKENGTAAAMLDMGSCTCVVGIGGSSDIPPFFPTISLSAEVVGDEVARRADSLSHEHSISLPILHANETGIFTYAKPVFDYALKRLRAAEYANGVMLLSDQLIGGQQAKTEMATKRKKIAELIFEINPHLQKIAFVNESLLSLISTGRTTGIVLHIGFARSTCAVIVDSKIQNLLSLPTRVVGGQLHSRMMLQSVFARGQAYQPSIADMFTHVPVLKRHCYVCADPDEELKKHVDETSVEVTLDHKTKVVLQQERFTSSEVFFFFGFPAMVVEAINSASTWECNSHRATSAIRNARDKSHTTVMSPQLGNQTTATSSSSTAQRSQHTSPANAAAAGREQAARLQQAAIAAAQLAQQHAAHAQQLAAEGRPAEEILASQQAAEAAAMQAQIHQQAAISAAQQAQSSGPIPLPSEVTGAMPSQQQPAQPAHPVEQANSEELDVNPDLTNLLLQNIVLSGRSAAFPGFAQRFQNDLNYILKKTVSARVQSADLEATWLGGSMLCKLAVLDDLAITRTEFTAAQAQGDEAVLACILRKMEFADDPLATHALLNTRHGGAAQSQPHTPPAGIPAAAMSAIPNNIVAAQPSAQ